MPYYNKVVGALAGWPTRFQPAGEPTGRPACPTRARHLHQHTRAARARNSANMGSANKVSVALTICHQVP